MSEQPGEGAANEQHQTIVPAESSGQRFDAFLASVFTQFSRVQLRRSINAAEATVNGKRCKAAYRLREGEVIEVRFPKDAVVVGPEPEDIPLDILFEDESIVVINKQHGMVVHPSKGHWSGTLTSALAFHFKNLSSVGGPTRPGIIHRLDRDTSGVIVVAKTDKAHLHVSSQFEARSVEKEYFALCRGDYDRDRDTIDQPIGMHPYQREKMAIRPDHSTSRNAVTRFEVAERFRGFTAFHVFPKTGRTHQIRVHLAHAGCPVLCDPLYSGRKFLTAGEITGRPTDERRVLERLALHAKRIRFEHPETGKPIEVSAPIPDILEAAMTELRTECQQSRR